MVVLTLLLASASASRAAEKSSVSPQLPKPVTKEAKTSAAAPADQKPVEIAMTGSYLKQPIRRNGVVTDGPNPVVVLSRKAIENSGAADLRELLVFRGVAR